MKFFFTSILVALAVSCSAQTIEVGYSPTSTLGWGKLPNTAKFNIGFVYPLAPIGAVTYTPGIRYTYLNSRSNAVDRLDDPVKGSYKMLFALPLSFQYDFQPITIINQFGVGMSDQPFPNDNGLFVNLLLEVGMRYNFTQHFSLSLRYSHISNGFRGRTNPGVDNIVLSTGIHF